MKKVKLFTHTDLDGIGCAILGILAFDKINIDIEYCDYNNVNEKVEEFMIGNNKWQYDEVYITDISVNKETANIIDDYHNVNNLSIKLLDHHETALWLNEYQWAKVKIIDDNKSEKTSGTRLFYNHLIDKDYLLTYIDDMSDIEKFVEMVNRYDTWLWKEKYNDIEPKKWNDLFYILGRDKFIREITYKLIANDLSLLYTDNLLLELEQEKIDKYVEDKNKNIIVKEICNYQAGIVFGEQYHSELGNRLSELHPELDFIIIINLNKSISYRTIKDNIHLANDVAKIYGGGGHAKAAGSEISYKVKEKIIDMLFNGVI